MSRFVVGGDGCDLDSVHWLWPWRATVKDVVAHGTGDSCRKREREWRYVRRRGSERRGMQRWLGREGTESVIVY